MLGDERPPPYVAGALLEAPPPPPFATSGVWIAHDASFIDTDAGGRTRLGAALRRIVLLLLRLHAERSGRSASLEELLAAGWPAERMHPDSARNRLHVALSKLRKLGLGAVLERFDTGYRLSPDANVRDVREGRPGSRP